LVSAVSICEWADAVLANAEYGRCLHAFMLVPGPCYIKRVISMKITTHCVDFVLTLSICGVNFVARNLLM